tara:strand:+ start:183 stop:368 length:186 start_codon:yes stop_codon:yes gene_type:complete
MDWLVYPIRDFLVWMFENTLEPASNYPNLIFSLLLLFGATYWMLLQHKLNKKADSDPDQIK